MNLRRYSYVAMIVALATCLSGQAFSQIYRIQNTHAVAFFAQIAQGRQDANVEWRTTFTFSNPNADNPVSGTLYFGDDEGQSMLLNFGNGPVSQIPITIPSLGSTTLTGVADGSALKIGAAAAVFDTPVHGVATYGLVSQSQALSVVSVPASHPTVAYFSAATATLGIALLNYADSSLSVNIRANGNDGSEQIVELTLPPWGHRAFFLNEVFPNLASTFAGTVRIAAGGREFVALTLQTADKTIYSSLPSGAIALPAPHYYQIYDVFTRIKEAARFFEVPNADSIRLTISEDAEVNASAYSDGTIKINLALAELIADSPSELAFVIGHEFGHVYQFETDPIRRFDFVNKERDADAWGFWLSLVAGYDPYAGAGFFAKAAMATGTAGLAIQNWEAEYSLADAHGSFNERLDNIYESIQEWCADPDVSETCATYKALHHPHFPPSVLLATVEP